MDYIKIRFGDNFPELHPGIEKTIEDMFQAIGPIFKISERSWKPQMDMFETPEEIVVIAEIAGVAKENLEVEINSKAVRIYGIREVVPRMDGARYRLAEIQYGSFERILFLPSQIDPEVVSASYSNGLLNIRMAKIVLNKTYKIAIDSD